MFTKDSFICCLCGQCLYSIDEYVTHMLKDENCTLDLQASSCMKELLLPRFICKKDGSITKDINLLSDASSINKSEFSLDQKGTSFAEFASSENKLCYEIETGSGIRWKCRLCLLTFSRQAAHFNHLQLQHGMKNELETVELTSTNVKAEPSDCHSNLKAQHKLVFSDKEKFKFPDFNLNNVKKTEASPVCHICGQIFKMETVLLRHVSTVHSEKRPYICEINVCNMTFNTKGSLIRHQRRHTGDRPFECIRCGRNFRESGSLLRHHQSRMSCDSKPGRKLGRYGVTLPFKNVISDNKADCKISLKKEEPLSSTNNDPSERGLTALFSDSTIKLGKETKATVQLQIQSSVTNSNDLPVTRAVLKVDQALPEKQILLNIKDLKKEIILHEDQKESKKSDIISDLKPSVQEWKHTFKCFVCHKVYKKEANLSSHMKSHLVQLGKECSTCHKRFESDYALARHLVCHSTAKQFECNICRKSFKLKSHAQSHLNSHNDEKTVSCPECGGHFKTASSRNNHLKIHFGERDFECAVCYKKFLVKASLDRHLRIHSQERPFKCSFCHRKFREHGTLSRHIKNRHRYLQMHNLENGKINSQNVDMEIKQLNKMSFDDMPETLSEINDTLSENGSELESYLSEKVDLSSLYSEPTDIAFEPEEYLLPASFSHFKHFCNDDIDMDANNGLLTPTD